MVLIFKTERLYLRQFEISDHNSLFGLNADIDVIKYTGDSHFQSAEQAETFIKSYSHYHQFGYGRWAVVLKNNNAFTGWCGLKFTSRNQQTDLGFRFFKKYWNNGYATEAAKACIEYGFNQCGLTRIVGRVRNENTASIKVLMKAGLKFEKHIDFDGYEGSLFVINK